MHNKLAQKAYINPFLPLADVMSSQTGRSILAGDDMTLKAWSAIFQHLRDTGVQATDDSSTGGDANFADTIDTGLQRFMMAMKTPPGRKPVKPLTELSAKRLRLGEDGDDSS